MADVVDDARQLLTDFGMRPYRVFSVVIAWSGGEIGRGTESVLRETEMLPTPRVQMATLRSDARDAGRLERGIVKLDQISPRYTEDDLSALFPRALKRGEQAFIEVRMDRRDGADVRRRRFGYSDVPRRQPDRFDWAVDMTPQDDRRTNGGQLAQPPRDPLSAEFERRNS